MMKMSTLSMLVALAPLVVACAPDDEATAGIDSEHVATSQEALLGGSKILWPMQDGKATVRVCWLPLDLGGKPMPGGTFALDANKVLAERKAWIREGVEREWNAKTVMNFVGWEDCGAGEADIKMVPGSSNTAAVCGPNNVIIGTNCVEAIGLPDKGKRVFINVLFGDEATGAYRYLQTVNRNTVNPALVGTVFRPAICGTQLDAGFTHFNNNQPVTNADIAGIMPVYKDCLQNVSNHEFGHIAGFSHEQDRTDTSAACRAQYPLSTHDDPSEVDSPLGAWEEDSIMSYCRITLPGTLTAEDIKETNAFYEKYAPKLPSAKPKSETTDPTDPTTQDPTGGGEEQAPAPTPAKKKKTAPVAQVEKGGCNGN